MSALETLEDTWRTYQTTIECLKVVGRVIKRNNLAALDKSAFIGANPEAATSQILASTDHADDYVILTLWAHFERFMFFQVSEESRRMVQGNSGALTREVQEKFERDIEYWRVDDVLDIFKTVVDNDLIGRAKQIKKYRDWVAHRNTRKSQPANVLPQTAYTVLSRIVRDIETKCNVTDNNQAQVVL